MIAQTPFTIDPDSIDPAAIPTRTLASGDRIPMIGAGTFGSDHCDHQTVAQGVLGAAAVGYRHFDCASVYGNEPEIGHSLTRIQSLIPRQDLWITSKVWNDAHSPEAVAASCRKSLADLQLDYLDLYLVHWPFPNYHPPQCDVHTRNPNSRPYNHSQFMETWAAMEKLVEQGLVRNIGTSNVTIPKLRQILADAHIRPAVNEMELHPHFQQQELFDFVVAQNIQPIGYCPVGSPARPDRDRTPEDTCDIEDPVMIEIAKNHHIHPATLSIKWAVQRGQIPIPFSMTRRNYLANIQALLSPPLTDAEMSAIAQIDRNCRLIKGQVFLWEGAHGWEDLWDLDGTITTHPNYA